MKSTKNTRLLKYGVGILLILAIPIIFFQLMGVNILDLNNSNKRTIAIVNEDMGLTKDAEQVQMGVEVVSILAEDSDFGWKVMGRGAAENGLKSNQYDAIVYIPSNFSENIMSYDEQNPKKAEFAYQVQRQKTGLRKEQVLHEIEVATDRVNDKISTLYWSYIAQEMNHIKKEFTSILGKETEFLSSMSAYYKPESETLAEQMQTQKDQMAALQTTIGSANNAHNSRIENADTFGLQMNNFITYIQQYKEFQNTQRQILQQVQDASLAKIHATAATQAEQFNQSVQMLEESNNNINEEIQKVNHVIDTNKEKFNELSELRKNEVDRQLADLLVVQGTAIDRYNNTILDSLEKGIEAGKSGNAVLAAASIGTEPNQFTSIKEQLEKKAADKASVVLPGLEEQRVKVDSILTGLTSLKTKVAETDPASAFISEIDILQAELGSITAALSEREATWANTNQTATTDYTQASADYAKLLENYNSIYREYESIQQIINTYPTDTARIGMEIMQKENDLLANPNVSKNQKDRLQELFDKGAAKTDTSSLLSYYATLEQFEFTLNEGGGSANKDAILKDEILTALLKNVVNINELELEGWTSVEESIPETELGMSDLSTTFAAIMSGYKETAEQQHASLISELNSIDEQANVLLAQIQNPANMIPSGEPVATTSEGQVMAGQQNVTSQLVTLSGMIQSLSQKQSSLVDYANDLTVKADNIKETSNEFSGKWDTNVNAMSDFDNDIQEFLANTYVDGQENGYAFNHFVNPLEVKGEAAVSDEMEKVPPVILFIILLISSLLIGYFSYQMKEGPIGLQLALTALLSILVGLIISFYSIYMYILNDHRALEWTIFTILLLLTGAAIIRAALEFGQSVGWLASVALMCLYIIPLLILAVPDINIPDVLSTVYMSIKYEPETSFMWGAVITAVIALAMLATTYFMSTNKSKASVADEAYES
ncbi:type VII secretion protein EsaA, N-terminal domain-containing protein [Psychrobacillus psychrotolerans]|uniref:Type VII secretion protein EsaA, N-terminal domain-containing protein n=1 Tax=Psychrobacillus psychrotolerans TaxID=126156 RepID=A0A1I5Z8E2_9BACI|nr:type VII secretion protein EsaA [Psychrobacillus psychrotolerans]SFQ52730.1 type VII secretion protein EsaA, N-terminal domain-containing protein [Psychrobacillus psychrotolerans]